MLEFEEYKQKLNADRPKLEVLRSALKLDAAEREIEELEAASAREGFWNDVENSQKVQKRLKKLQNKRDNYNRLCSNWEDLMTLCDMAIEEGDDSLFEELQSEYAAFEEKLEETRLSTLLTGEYDGNNAILTFHAGAGGTEAQDWASMLYRMYNMWAERHGYKVKVMDYLDGDEAGLKSATIMIEGENAYGFLKSEHGIHRLVRVSPFDAAGRSRSCPRSRTIPRSSCARRTSRWMCSGRDQGTGTPGKDQRHQGRADENRMGQSDPFLRFYALSAREGSSDRVRKRQHPERHGRGPGRVYQRISVHAGGKLKNPLIFARNSCNALGMQI